MADYYDSFDFGEPSISSDVQYAVKQGQEHKSMDFLGAAFEEAMSPFAVKRIWDRRSSQFESDTEWAIDEETEKDLSENYTIDETKYLKDTKSEAEFLARKKFIKEDKDRRMKIGEAGASGIAANIAFSLIDPIAIAAGAASGGISWGSKATGVAKALRMATLSGIENAAVETILAKGNTQSDAWDVLTAFGAGAAIGGAISPLVRSKNPALAAGADEADRAISADVDSLVSQEITSRARSAESTLMDKAFPGIDARQVQKRFDEHEVGLMRETKGQLTQGQVNQVKKRIKELEGDVKVENDIIREVQAKETVKREQILQEQAAYVEQAGPRRAEIETKYADAIAKQEERIRKVEKNLEKARDKQKQSAKLWKEEMKLNDLKKNMSTELKKVEADMKAKVASAEWKFRQSFAKRAAESNARRAFLEDSLSGHRTILARGARARKSSNALREWKQLPDVERLKRLYVDKKIPMRQAEVDRQIEATADIITEDAERVATTQAIGVGDAAPRPSTVEIPGAVEPGSVGAMKAGDRMLHRIHKLTFDAQKVIARFAQDGGNMPENLRGRRLLPSFTKNLQSLHTRLSNSDNMAIRGLTYHLFEAPQGGSAAAVTAAARVKNYSTQIRSAMRNRMNEGLEEWGVNQGLNRIQTLMKQENFSSYHKMVMLEVKKPGTYSDPAIIKGAEGVRDQLREAGRIRMEAGEAGFENIDLDANYIPIIMNETTIKNATIQHGNAKVIDVISLGYQQGKYKMNKKLADRVAEGYVKRSLDHSLTMSDVARSTTDTDVQSLSEALANSGVEPDIIKDFMESTMQKELREHMSNRAKKSLEPDLNAELNGLKLIDLVDSDVPKLPESYTRDSAGGAAMAKLGFKTRSQVLDFMNDLQRQSDNLGLNPTEVAEEVQVLRDGIDMLYGRSINPDAYSPLVRNISRLRDATSFLRLQSVGIASIPELARVTAQRGVKLVLENCKDLGIGISGTKNIRKGGKYSGQFERADLDELEQVMGYVGEDHVLYPNGLRVDNLEESGLYNSLGAKVDNALAQGKRVQEIISAFRMVQGSGEKLAARSLGSQIKKLVDGIGDGLSKANINDAGWSDGFLDDIKAWMQANPAVDVFNGKEVRLFNFGKMPADMQERLQIGMHRLVSRDMQRPFVGETPVFMHKWLGQTVTQFRSFSLLSLEKQLVHDVRHDRAAGAIIALQSGFMGYAALTISALQRGIGRDDADDYIMKQLTGMNAILGTFNRMGQVASAGIALDMLATLGALPDDMMAAPGQTGYRGLTASAIPVIGMVGDTTEVVKDLVTTLKGEPDKNKLIKDVQQVVPFGKAIGVNQAFNAIAR